MNENSFKPAWLLRQNCPDFCVGYKNLNVGKNATNNVNNVNLSLNCNTANRQSVNIVDSKTQTQPPQSLEKFKHMEDKRILVY